MKANYIFAALAVVALASCSKSEIVEQNPTAKEQAIAFTNYTGGATRASVLDATGLQTPGFGVYAIQNSETALFMTNVNPKGSDWTYTPLKFWPKDTNNKLNFYFYAPYSNTTTNIAAPTFSTSGDKTVDFTVNSTIADQTDLLWAAPVLNAVYGGNMLESSTNKVPVHFNHALSRIGFTAQRDAAYDGITIKINSVSIKGNFNTAGTMNIAADASANVWSSVTPTANTVYTPTLENNANITTTATKINTDSQYIMVVPSTSSAKTSYTITVNYTVTDSENVATTNEITSTSADLAFEIGKAYTFNVKIGLKAIEFTADVATWAEQTASDVAIN